MKLTRSIIPKINMRKGNYFAVEINVPIDSEVGQWFKSNEDFTAEVKDGRVILK